MFGFVKSQAENSPVAAVPPTASKSPHEEVQDLARALRDLSLPEGYEAEPAQPNVHPDAERLSQLLAGGSPATFGELAVLVERIDGQLRMLNTILSDPHLRSKLSIDAPAETIGAIEKTEASHPAALG